MELRLWFVQRVPLAVAGVLVLAGIPLVIGIAGSVTYPVAGSLLGMDRGLAWMALEGLKDGAFYGGIWSPGIALVACIMLFRHRRRQHGKDKTDDTLGEGPCDRSSAGGL